MSKKTGGAAATKSVIDVYVKLPSGRTSVQNLTPDERVSRIYQNVADEEGVPVESVRIKYTGKVLKKKDTIGYLGICRETILKGEIVVPKELPVFIKCSDGQRFMISARNIDTISALKQKIYNKEGHIPSQQCLKFGGRVLDQDCECLLDAGVPPEAIIDLSMVNSSAATNLDNEAPEETKEAVLNSFSSDGRPVEVVFSFDTTGSMYSCLTEVRSKLREACQRLLRDIPNIRIGIMAQGDYCDQFSSYVIRSLDLTTDVDTLTEFAQSVPSSGGGDSPECYELVLKKAQLLDWSDAAAKALVVIGDCEPHPPSYTDQSINWHEELNILAGMDIKVYGVQAQNNSNVRQFYEELADRTGGCYINFKHFNLITDMFLAVCYKESSPEQLEAYCEEVREDGRMTEETQHMFNQLEEQTTPNKRETKSSDRYVRAAWWDPSLDKQKTPSYKYDHEKDQWKPLSRPATAPSSSVAPVHLPITTSVTRKSFKKKKRGCELM